MIEVLSVFLLVMVIIWFFQQQMVPFVALVGVIGGIIITGFIVRLRASTSVSAYAREIGLGYWDSEKQELVLPCSWVVKLACGVVLGLSLILVAGCFLRPEFWLERKFWPKAIYGVQGYIVWGMIQQFVLHAAVTSKIYSIFAKDADPRIVEQRAVLFTALVSGILFFLVHMPNPKLMIVTPIAGAATAYIFLNCRNIYILGIAHGILGTAIQLCLPLSINVGPYFWQKPG